MLGSTGQILSQEARSRVARRGIMHWGARVYSSKNLKILNHSGAKANSGMTWIISLRNYSSAIIELVFKKWFISIKQAILLLNLNKSFAFAPRWFPFIGSLGMSGNFPLLSCGIISKNVNISPIFSCSIIEELFTFWDIVLELTEFFSLFPWRLYRVPFPYSWMTS